MEQEAVGEWERLPEVVTNRQYVRCLDRLFQSLPASARLRLSRAMLPATVSIAAGATCFHSGLLKGAPPTPEEREVHRQRALDGIRASREGLGRIRGIRGADRADVRGASAA